MKLSTFLLFDRGRGAEIDVVRRGLDLAVAADESGLDTLWVAEHHFGDDWGMPNPAVFLAAVATRTRRIRLGPAVAVLPFRQAVFTAEDYALVDRLSGGRLVLGVGSGAVEAEFRAFGLDPETRPTVFVDRLAELRRLWGDDGGGAGGLRLGLRPLQRPLPPLYVATNRGESAYLAGRDGLGLLTLVSPTLGSLDPIASRLAEHRRGMREAGLDRRAVPNAVVLMAAVAPSARSARRLMLEPLERFAEAQGVPREDDVPLYDRLRLRGTAAFGSTGEAAAVVARLRAMGAEEVVLWSCVGPMATGNAVRLLRGAAALRSALAPRRRATRVPARSRQARESARAGSGRRLPAAIDRAIAARESGAGGGSP